MDLGLVTAGEVPRGNWKVLVFGPSGSGKTWAAARVPDAIVMECEANGVDTILRSNPLAQLVRVGGRPYLTTIAEFGAVMKAAADGRFAGKRLVIDSLTEVQQMIKDDILRDSVKQRQDGRETKFRAGREGGGRTEDARDEELFSQADWEELTERKRRLYRTLRDLPMDVVCLALDECLYDDKGKLYRVRPGFQGRKLGEEVGRYFNGVGYMQKTLAPGANKGEVRVTRQVLFAAPPMYVSKECGALDGAVAPDGAEWFRLLRGEPAPAVKDELTKEKRGRKAASNEQVQEVSDGNA